MHIDRFFYCIQRLILNMLYRSCIDSVSWNFFVATVRTIDGGAQGGDDDEILDNLEEGLMRMTFAISVTHLDHIPLHMQRHTVGVGSHFSQLPKKVA